LDGPPSRVGRQTGSYRMSDRHADHPTQKSVMEHGVCFTVMAGALTLVAILLQWALHLLP